MGRIIRGYWDCSSCGTTGISGDERNCPGCGKARGDDVVFYMKDKEYLSEEEAAKVSKEADWYCSYCGALNSANETECKGCGASKEESEKNYHDLRKEEAEKAQKKEDRKHAAENAAKEAALESKKKRRKFIGLGILAAIILAIVIALIPHTTEAQVTGLDWARSIAIEQYQNVEESDWELPEGANLHSTAQEIHHYDQVLDHYDTQLVEKSREVQDGYDTTYEYVDLGNGNFEEVEHQTPKYVTEYYTEEEQVPVYRDEPVYQTKYYYDIWKWIEVRTVDTNGSDHNAVWGDTNLASDEREGATTELYTFTVETEKGKSITYALDEANWNGLNIGDSVAIKTKAGSAQLLDESGNAVCELEEQ